MWHYIEGRLGILILVLVCWPDNPNLWCVGYFVILHLLFVNWTKIDSSNHSRRSIIFATLIWIHGLCRKYFLSFCERLTLLSLYTSWILLRNWLWIWRPFSTPRCLLLLLLAVHDLYCMLRTGRCSSICIPSYRRWFFRPNITFDNGGSEGLFSLASFHLRAKVHLLFWSFFSRLSGPVRLCWNRLMLS